MSESRKDVLLKALEAEVGGASVDPGTLFTDDVVGWSPLASVSGLTALADVSAVHDVAFSNVVIMCRGLDEVGNKAFAEWVVEADHEAHIRREASATMGLGDEVDLAIFVRDAGTVIAGISGWTWGDCCELQNLWVEPTLRGRGLATRLIAAAEAEAAARGCSQTVHFTYDFQARALYERNGYELVGRVEDFPTGTDVLWYRKRLQTTGVPADATLDRS